MTKRGLLMLFGVLTVVVFITILAATSISSDDSPSHTMPGGETMQGEQMER
jgi:hypothetical protein